MFRYVIMRFEGMFKFPCEQFGPDTHHTTVANLEAIIN